VTIEPSEQPAPATPITAMPISVATWNLWWRFGEFAERQEPIARALRAADADIICLQEVWAVEGEHDQAAWLAKQTDRHFRREDTAARNGMSFANAVLSRWPIIASTNHALPGIDNKPSHRKAMHVVIDSPRGHLHVFCTHLDQRFDNSTLRQRQLHAICELASAIERDSKTDFPIILAGDLNAVPDSDEIRSLTGRRPPYVQGLVFTDAWEVGGPFGDPGWTWRADNPLLNRQAQWPNRRLDYVLTSWPRTSGQGTPETARLLGTKPDAETGVMPSDHAGLFVTLR
jgi:endonuclease/exonuclease/phosphatase family metal-dependent hydrolase